MIITDPEDIIYSIYRFLVQRMIKMECFVPEIACETLMSASYVWLILHVHRTLTLTQVATGRSDSAEHDLYMYSGVRMFGPSRFS